MHNDLPTTTVHFPFQPLYLGPHALGKRNFTMGVDGFFPDVVPAVAEFQTGFGRPVELRYRLINGRLCGGRRRKSDNRADQGFLNPNTLPVASPL